MLRPYDCGGRLGVFSSQNQRTIPTIIDATLAVCALDIPKKDRGLMRMNSTRKRAAPVSTRYTAKTVPAGTDFLPGADFCRSYILHKSQAMAQAAINS